MTVTLHVIALPTYSAWISILQVYLTTYKSQDVFSFSADNHFLASAVSLVISPLFFFAHNTHLQKLGQYLNELLSILSDMGDIPWCLASGLAAIYIICEGPHPLPEPIVDIFSTGDCTPRIQRFAPWALMIVGFLAIQSVDTQTASPHRLSIQGSQLYFGIFEHRHYCGRSTPSSPSGYKVSWLTAHFLMKLMDCLQVPK